MLSAPPEALSYKPEIDFEITGTVHDESGTPLPYARLVMLAGRGREAFAAEDTADAEGHIGFAGHAFPDRHRVLLRARNENGNRTGQNTIGDEDHKRWIEHQGQRHAYTRS